MTDSLFDADVYGPGRSHRASPSRKSGETNTTFDPSWFILGQKNRQPVRTYGISPSGFDYDAAIQAAAEYSVPRPQSPNRGSVKR